ncbi:MAG: alpha/beta hydrolase-fold protein [Bacteroidota bacterium]
MNSRNEPAASTITFELSTPSDDGRPVYWVGNFNQWKAADPRYRLEKQEKGKYRIRLSPEASWPALIEYKYTRGQWDGVELDSLGNSTSNRQVLQEQKKIADHVPSWMNAGKSYSDAFLPKIQVISETFEMPELIKTRRIAALLPYNYDQSQKRYPVLYLQDGQNLFDDYAPYGNWALDKKLAFLAERGMGEIIVIAIDHASEERVAEFTPSYQTKLGVGDGKQYAQFLSKTLKNYVDDHFRTLPQRIHTGIGGSSMGGLISMYAGLKYPEVYSKLMIFSPSLWVDPNIAIRADEYFATFESKIYIYAGEKESPTMLPNILRFKSALEKNRIDESRIAFQLSVDPKGEHNEHRWGIEFPKAIEWLFFKKHESLS